MADPQAERSSSTETGSEEEYEDYEAKDVLGPSAQLRRADSRLDDIPADERNTLRRLASSMRGASYLQPSSTLERKDTLDGVEVGDPVLDPESDQFDSYKWARMALRLFNEAGVKPRRAGIMFRDMNVSGSGAALVLQKNVGSVLMTPLRLGEVFRSGPEKQILRDFDGLLKSGEMLIVLGRPGSGCSTLLKTLCGELNGLDLQQGSDISFNGIPMEIMHKQFKGEICYNQEVDKHFPHLTVGETLEFAAATRVPQQRPLKVSRKDYYQHMAKVVMSILGLSHTFKTKVGNDYVRGVSGGERKRVSIGEMMLAGSPIAAWDNSTRGLDSASALEFVQALKMFADLAGSCHAVAIYQASQAIYDVFDKAVVLYEGRQIYYGPCDQAVAYFVDMGWEKPARQNSGDFLTSVTNPSERNARKGFEDRVPRTPDEFAQHWKNSQQYAALQKEMAAHAEEFPVSGEAQLQDFTNSKVQGQAKHVRPKSPYIISLPMQIKLCTKRAYQRLWNDQVSTVTTIIGQIVMSLIIGSVFYGSPDATAGFFSKGAVLFFAVLLNALISISEINSLYDQRPIVEKQASYAFVHPAAEAVAGIVSDIPVKFIIAVVFNIILYFLAGLRREPGQFFIYFLFLFVSILTMSAVFRTLAASTKTLSQAMALAGVMVLAIVIYSGFLITTPNMHPWFSWIRFLNPVYYAFEALLTNEFHGRQFTCSQFVPAYPVITGDQFICSSVGAVAGQRFVSGDAFVEQNYSYSYSHIWRNLGILFAFMIGFYTFYFAASELNSATSSTAEFLVFRRGHVPSYMKNLDKKQANGESVEGATASAQRDEKEDDSVGNVIPAQKDIFTFRDLCYDIPLAGGHRRLLDHVSGFVRPGTLTALMGVSGAGKTTLLDVLAQRVSLGVVTGDMLVNGKPLSPSFQRSTGYVQQQDLHLETTTVREALRFSAMLRQPKSVPTQEKYDYVEEVIKMLGMSDYSEAVVGVPGEGLNVEQRKLLTIGVELAAKPALLLFLDEPTSGLDSQSAWSICAFLRKLADNGQAVLCTIHQPSALLFQTFDRLLFLAKGGKTVYFGDIGDQSRTLLDYFESNGARACDESENPAEYMLEIIGAGAAGKSSQDWPSTWLQSQEAKDVQAELDRLHEEKKNEQSADEKGDGTNGEFAMPFTTQLVYVTARVFQQYWRTPSYVFSKFVLGIASALFIGFSFFKADSTQAGLQEIIFSVFMLTSIFSTLVQQIMPRFVTQRSLYEVRERPSKSYSWAAFLIANIVVEIPYQIMLGIVVWASFYFPTFGAGQSPERQGLMLLFAIQFFIFASTFAAMVIAALPDAETGGNIATLLFSLLLIFNGVMQSPSALPGFWIFMYRVSSLTYLIAGMTAVGLHERPVICSARELSIFNPPANQSCGEYLAEYLLAAPGHLNNPSAMTACEYCPLTVGDQFLAGSNIYWSERWRNFGIGWAYVGFNIAAAVGLYYAFRVRHWKPSSVVVGIKKGGRVVGRMFKTRSGETPRGKEARNGKIF